MWEKIVLNRLSNAFKFTFEGSITVRFRVVDGFAELDVTDTGAGIEERHLPRLFERFHRVEGVRSRSHEGSGIGLALVRELTRRHGGDVQAVSNARGTTFKVRIPEGPAHSPDERITPTRALGSMTTASGPYLQEALQWATPVRDSMPPPSLVAEIETVAGPRPRIVWADDNADMREYVARLLGTRWNVETVADGAAALQAIRRDAPALVLCDVMMPRLDGFGLLRELRAAPATRNLPVIFLSARAGEESTVDGLQAGANDYLIKPFSARELLARVSSQLKIAALRDEVERGREDARRLIETLFNSAPASIALIRGPELVIEFANPRCVELWQRRSASELVGKPLLVAMPELRGQGFDDLLKQVMTTGESRFGSEVPATLLRDGKKVTVRLNFVYVPTRDAAGGIDGVSVFAFDVTPEVAARARAQLGEHIGQALVTNEGLSDQLRHCCEALVPAGAALAQIWTYDATQQVLDLRAAAGAEMDTTETLTRLALGERSVGQIAASRTAHVIHDVVGDPRVPEQPWARREGIASFAGYPLLVGDRLVGVLTLFARDELSRDTLAAVSTVADQIAIAVDRDSGERFRELSMGMLAHDLRNPLNAILMGAQLVMTTASALQEQMLTRVISSAKRMDRMVAQVLDLTRARSGGGIPIRLAWADLHAICAQTVAELSTVNPRRSIEVKTTGDCSGMWDSDRMAQVFSNLLANALAYGRHDTTIDVVLNATDTQVQCSVRNSGPAIPAELLPTLFNPFRRARKFEATVTQGLGLGLFISQQIVAAHGGTISVRSTEQEGTQFTMLLPKRARTST
jgi:signal transduction histidine kinase/CheY-like chemotaxis protein